MLRPIRLASAPRPAPRLGNPGPGRVQVSIVDENGRPFPHVDVSLVLPDDQSVLKRNVGPTGTTVIETREIPAGEKVILSPDVSMEFASDPPYHEIEPGENGPAEVTFMVAMRQPEKDYLTPIITFAAGGIATGVIMWGLGKMGVEL